MASVLKLFQAKKECLQYCCNLRMLTAHYSGQSPAFGDYTKTTDRETHFGFENVKENEKSNKVYEVFERVADKYDLMNDAMSVGIHRLWKDYFMSQLAPAPGTKLLDVAGGTGDIAFRFLKYVKQKELVTSECKQDKDSSQNRIKNHGQGSHVTVCDINQAMLDVGQGKAMSLSHSAGVAWIKGDAECLPLPDNTYDAYTIAFGIRNCTHIDNVIQEAYRVLKPGGRFMCLEFSQVTNPAARHLYDLFSFEVIPVLGQIIANDWRSYQYLVESIRKFPSQSEFKTQIENAGFCAVSFENLTLGVACIHSAIKL